MVRQGDLGHIPVHQGERRRCGKLHGEPAIGDVMQRRGPDALAPALQHGIGAAALAKLGVEPGVRWHLGDAVVDPSVKDAGAVLAGDLAALAVAETPTLDRVHGACSNMLANTVGSEPLQAAEPHRGSNLNPPKENAGMAG